MDVLQQFLICYLKIMSTVFITQNFNGKTYLQWKARFVTVNLVFRCYIIFYFELFKLVHAILHKLALISLLFHFYIYLTSQKTIKPRYSWSIFIKCFDFHIGFIQILYNLTASIIWAFDLGKPRFAILITHSANLELKRHQI